VEVDERVSREVDGQRQALMIVETEPSLRVDGSHLRAVSAGFDNVASPCVNFRMTMQGATLFGALTGSNLPDKQSGLYRLLGVVMDDELISAPRIMSRITDDGQITGNFTQKEVDFLVDVLRAGRLPAVLQDEPISENTISPLLGMDTIRKGAFAIGFSLVAVLVFILFYYHFSGVIACLALITNLLLILALMILISAAFTLPGLAGLVLTVGMSVDANVLIFERIREELNRGAALRMAIRNGFGRATTTIVDANLTTLITALVLYGIGTDQIRGFAVTLILGILVSMYTAIFCSRVVFDIAERRKWITRLSMLHILGATNIDFIGKRKIAGALSVVLIGIGLVAAGMRGERIFDIDFLGGTSVQPVFKAPQDIEWVRGQASDLADDVSVTQVDTEGYEKGRIYKIDTSLGKVEDLEQRIAQIFQQDGESLLETREMSFVTPVELSPSGAETSLDSDAATDPTSYVPRPARPVAWNGTTEPPPVDRPVLLAMADQAELGLENEVVNAAVEESETAADLASDAPAPEEQAGDDSGPSDAGADVTSEVADETTEPSPDEAAEQESSVEATPDSTATDEQAGEDTPSDASDEGPAGEESPAPRGEPPAETPAAEAETPAAADDASVLPATTQDEVPETLSYRSETEITFKEKMSASALRDRIESVAQQLELTTPEVAIEAISTDGDDGSKYRVRFSSTLADTAAICEKMRADVQGTPVVLSASTIGGAVADKTTNLAIAALGTSLLGIVAYIWIRFQRVVYGLAAVVALVHDVAFTIGAVGLSFWLSHVFGFLLIDEFKISLPVVAALLTIIGYSLNDTIVVFDRIREVKGKSPQLTEEIVNTSINQTLSRTLLTSTTTLLVVGILYAFGGQGIHGFAFALLVGVLVGTYSSIFVASPALLWMSQKWAPAAARRNAPGPS
jgi:SecD/SecF fusion protein